MMGTGLRRIIYGRRVRRLTKRAMESYESGHLDDAERLLREAMEYGTEHPEVFYSLAVVLEKRGLTKEAEMLYRRAVDLGGGTVPSYYIDLAGALHRQGRRPEAEEVYREGLSKHPDNPILHANYATFLRDKGRFDEAEVHYKRALECADPETRKILQERYGL